MKADLTEFEDFAYENYKARTIQNTLRSLRHLSMVGVDLDSRDSFRQWIVEMKRKGTLDRTINVYIKCYNRYLKFRNSLKIKPFHEIRSPYRPVAAIEDYEALIKAADTYGYTSERKRAKIEILFKTGLRLAEMASITLDDIEGDTMTVVGKGQKIAKVFLPESVKKAIDRYLKVRRSRGSNRVFINSKGEAMTYDGIRREIYKVAEKAGIKFSAHRARRFYARFLYKEGLDLEEIRLLMRHEKIDTTKDYIQMMQEDAIDVLRKRKIDFFEDETGSNPGRHSRLGRDLNPCHGLDRPV